MRNQRVIGIVATVVVVTIIVSAGLMYYGSDSNSPVKGEPLAIDTYATEDSVALLSEVMDEFSFDLYGKLSAQADEENLFLSPYSVFVALAMTYEGASGVTADEMASVLHVPQGNETMLCSFGRIYNLLNQDKEYTLSTANALWIKEEFPFLQSYLDYIDHYYMGKATPVNFTDASGAAEMINQWVEEQTKEKIKDLIAESDIDPLTALILTNAIYFKGLWAYQFDPASTTDGDFTLPSGESIQTPMMRYAKSGEYLNYSETEDVQIVELPYKGDALSMIVILPKEKDLAEIEANLDYETFTSWKQNLTQQTVDVVFPKFTMETEFSLKDVLMDMGMKTCFSQNADFSGMTGHKDLFIEKVRHKAFIEVTEEGTEAAAATSVHMALTSAPSMIEFHADHPFLFLIQLKETGTILFMGHVTAPTQ
jgi:serpin B